MILCFLVDHLLASFPSIVIVGKSDLNLSILVLLFLCFLNLDFLGGASDAIGVAEDVESEFGAGESDTNTVHVFEEADVRIVVATDERDNYDVVFFALVVVDS